MTTRMLKVSSALALGAALSAVAGVLRAQEPRDTARLSEIVVTATLVPSSAVTASTTVIRGSELRELGLTQVADALAALVPGASIVRTGSFGGATSLFLRGGEAGYTRVLIDGVPFNEPGGAFDFSILTTAGVDRIEVVRGPVSALYGSDAVTGVIQIFTRRGTGPPSFSTEISGGNYGTASLSTGLTGGSPTASYGLHLSRYQTTGIYAFNNAYHNATLSGAVRLVPDDGTDAVLTLHYIDDVYHVPTNGSGQVVDRNAFQFARRYAVGVDVGRRLSSMAEAHLQIHTYTTDGGFDNQSDGPGDTLGYYADRSLQTVERRSADARLNLYIPWGSVVTVGAQVEQERERSLDQSQSQFGPFDGLFDQDRKNGAAYAQMLGSVGRLAWNASARADRNGAFGTFGTYRVGAAILVASGLRVRSSFGTAFREPTFFENFAGGFVRGNPGLSPERTTSWEVAAEQTLPGSAGRISAAWFDQRFRNMIDFTFSPPSPGDPNYFNIAAARARGAELDLAVRVRGGFVIQGQYAYLDARVVDPGFDSTAFGLFVRGQRLIRRPAHAASLSMGYTHRERAGAHVRVSYVGARDDIDYANAARVSLAAYGTLGLSAEYTPVRRRGLSVVLRVHVDNLLDRAYEGAKGYPAPGRMLLGGGTVEF